MAYGKIKADTLVYDNSGSDVEIALSTIGAKANTANPTFTGTVTIPTPSANDNTTKAASTAYVQTELGDYATLASPTFTGTVTIPTPTAGDNTTKAASTAFVVDGFAPKAAPAFTGTATGVNLTLSGNLTVNGTTTTVATTNTTITDNLIELNSGATSNANDAGILIERGSTGDNAIIAWDESADKFIVGTTTAVNDATGDLTIAAGQIVAATFEGNLTGQATTAATATTVDVTANESTDELLYLAMVDGTSSSQGIEADSSLKYNPSTGIVTTTTGGFTDSKGDVRKIVQNTQGSTYTLVAADAGKHILASGTVTIPDGVFAAGDAVTIVNNTSGNLTLTKTITTMYLSTDGTSANRTLATRGMATILFVSGTVAYISGAGLS